MTDPPHLKSISFLMQKRLSAMIVHNCRIQ
jgi:hypothetical protein